MKVPIGIFGMAAGVASYPTISALVAAGAIVDAYDLLCRAIRSMLLLTFAAQVCLTVAGYEAVYLIWGLFAHRFTLSDTEQTAIVLAYLCIGLGGLAAQTVISRGFYALGSTWLPTIIGTIITILAVPAYVALRRQAGAIGLALASSLAITVYVAVLGLLQRRRFEREAAARGASLVGSERMLSPVLRMAAAAALASGLGLLLRAKLLSWLPDVTVGTILLRAMVLCSFGVSVYVALAYLFGVRDIADIKTIVMRKLHPHAVEGLPHD
jgi:putative peptidoglycan lipid II flippase